MELKPTIVYDDFARLDLRVATVLACEPHPNADRLLKLQLDVGPLGQRQICAGLRGFQEPDDLVGKQIVIVANLEPRKLRGEESNGMLLAASVTASADEGEPDQITDILVLQPRAAVPPGSSVS